jgi:Predicted membrane protein
VSYSLILESPWTTRFARWLQTRSFGFEIERLGITEGLRAATAVAGMVWLSQILHEPLLAWGAFAAFWTCLADPGGSDRLRFRIMAGFALVGTCVAALISTIAGLGPAIASPVLFAVVLACMFGRVLGPQAGLVGVLASVVAVVAVDYPNPLHNALKLAAIFFFGCLWAGVLCLVLWRVHPHRPARRAVAAIYRDLGYMAAGLEAVCRGFSPASSHHHAEHRRAVRSAIERARATVGHIAAGHRNGSARRGLMAWIEAGDRFLAGLIALEHEVETASDEVQRMALAELLWPLPVLLEVLARQAQNKRPDWAAVNAGVSQLKRIAQHRDGINSRVAAYWVAALEDLVANWQRGGEAVSPAAVAPRGVIFSQPVPALRHALRVALAVIIAYGASVLLHLPYSYWGTMAVVVVMQPQITATWPRMLERVLGSIAGGLIAAGLWLMAPAPAVLALVIFPLAAGCIAFRSVNYTLHVLFLTPLFVLVADLIDPGHGTGIAMARAMNNALGSLLGFAACLLFWPEPERQPLREKLAEAADANFSYAMLASDPSARSEDIEAARRAAGIASTAAEVVRERMVLEGRRKEANLDEAAGVLDALRRLAGASTAGWLAQRPAKGTKCCTLFSAGLGDYLRGRRKTLACMGDALGPEHQMDCAVSAAIRAGQIYVAAQSSRRSA